jgi:NTP pyrophosphatase (non-canonical NTP hydrolase)
VKMKDWNSVDDLLPGKHMQSVLGYIVSGGLVSVGDSMIDIVAYNKKENCWQQSIGSDDAVVKVTYWQLLPDTPDTDEFESAAIAADRLQKVCHGLARSAGWWDNPRETGTLLMLCVSELAEAMEGDRKGLQDDKLPHRKMLEVELADAVIRIFDMAGGLRLDVGGAIAEKLKYNIDRDDHKSESRQSVGGKKY